MACAEIRANRSSWAARWATTRVMTAATERQVIRSNAASTVNAAWQANHATVSSNALVNREPCRAHGTAATITPWVAQRTRGASACRNTRVVPASRPRHRRGPSPLSYRGDRQSHRPHRPCRDRVGRTVATNTSSPPWVSSSTFSTTVCATPSTDRHTLTARNAVPPDRELTFDSQEPSQETALRPKRSRSCYPRERQKSQTSSDTNPKISLVHGQIAGPGGGLPVTTDQMVSRRIPLADQYPPRGDGRKGA